MVRRICYTAAVVNLLKSGDHAVLELRVEERSASYSNRIVKLYIPIEHNPFSVDPAAWGGTSTTVSPEGGRMV